MARGGYYHGDDYIPYNDGNLAHSSKSTTNSPSYKKSFFESESYKKTRKKQKKLRQIRERNPSSLRDILMPEICDTCDKVYDKFKYKKCPYCNNLKVKSDFKPKYREEIIHKTKKSVPQYQKVVKNVFVKCPKCGRQYNETIYSKCPKCYSKVNKKSYASRKSIGLINLDDAGLIAYSSRKLPNNVPVGSYVKLGETIGRYGFTAAKDIRTH